MKINISFVGHIHARGYYSFSITKFYKTDPQKWEFWFKIHFKNFQKPKIKLRKDPPKFQKIKTCIRRLQIKKFYKTNPPKNGNFDSKYNFIVMKRGLKAFRTARRTMWAQRAPKPSAGAIRRGAEHPKILVLKKWFMLHNAHSTTTIMTFIKTQFTGYFYKVLAIYYQGGHS